MDIGKNIEISIPAKAIELVWSYRQSPECLLATIEESDFERTNKSAISIRGTVVYSFNDAQIVVRSKDSYFLLERTQVKTGTPSALDNPGAKILLSIPIRGIKHVWTTESGAF